MELLLGIDLGTTGVKLLLINRKGKVISSNSHEYPLSSPKPGWAEQHPDIWWNATIKAIKKITGSLNKNDEIVSVGLSGQMHGLVPLDSSINPIRPSILWCDQRTVEECKIIENKLGKKLIDTVSNPALTGFTAPKILWLKRNEPENYKIMSHFILPKDYIRYKLTGKICTDISDASGTLLLNVKKGVWAEDIIKELGIKKSILPYIAGSEEITGYVTKTASKLTGLKSGTPVVGGGADNTCAAVGTGIVHSGRVSSSIGSSGVVFAHTDNMLVDPETRVHTFNHSVPDNYYLMGVMLSAGLSFKWFRDNLGQKEINIEKQTGKDAYNQLSKSAANIDPGCEGLIFLPYLNGERTPHKDPFARGVFFGLSQRHTREHLVRAVMEGIVYGLMDSIEIIENLGLDIKQIRATGGGGKNKFWRQMQADVFNKPVVTLNNDEGPAYGAALLSGVGVNFYNSIEEAADSTVKIKSIVEPDPDKHDVYSDIHRRYKELYISLKDNFRNIRY